ncbi:MAG: transglutaminase family protein [Synergistaceae bacterium]|nr:transglutaminase family protein [Synergistaceae bacterium]
MRRLRYSYHMQLNFEEPVREHNFKLRCFPSTDARQKISDERIKIYPVHFSNSERDSFGNMCIYGTAKQIHSHFSVDVTGTAEIDINGRITAEPHKSGIFKYETPLTRAGKSIREFHMSLDPMNWMSHYERALYMMHELYDDFTYSPGTTGIATTAEQSFEFRRGVCQDYAHILLALCRLERIPCRYVAGMIPGEGATHAWTEVLDGDIWRPIDPTHNRECGDTYIKFSSGRDAQDCAINQGVFYGGGRQVQEVRVVVSEILP